MPIFVNSPQFQKALKRVGLSFFLRLFYFLYFQIMNEYLHQFIFFKIIYFWHPGKNLFEINICRYKEYTVQEITDYHMVNKHYRTNKSAPFLSYAASDLPRKNAKSCCLFFSFFFVVFILHFNFWIIVTKLRKSRNEIIWEKKAIWNTSVFSFFPVWCFDLFLNFPVVVFFFIDEKQETRIYQVLYSFFVSFSARFFDYFPR